MRSDEIVSYKVAKLLQEAGFKWRVEMSYSPDKELEYHSVKYFDDPKETYLPAPSFGVVLQWLRDIRNIFIEVRMALSGKYYFNIIHKGTGEKLNIPRKEYEEYNNAIRVALEIACNYLISGRLVWTETYKMVL